MRLCLLLAAIVGVGLSPVARASARAGDYSLQLIGDNGRVLPTFQEGGRTYAMGMLGHRYSLRLRNRSDHRVELVTAVDGRDVLDGQPSKLTDRGYVLDPHSELTIDGFRVSTESVAAFTFSSVHNSYAARMGGAAQDVGLIAVAVFREREDLPMAVAPSTPFWNALWGNDAQRSSADQPPPASAPSDAASMPTAEIASDKKGGVQLNGLGSAARAPAALSVGHVRAQSLADEPVAQLGTAFGEQRRSHVDELAFRRASSRPSAFLSLRYDDEAGFTAAGIDVEGRLLAAREARRRQSAQPFRGAAQPFVRAPPLVAR